jgi:hypothetical protein
MCVILGIHIHQECCQNEQHESVRCHDALHVLFEMIGASWMRFEERF